MLAHISHKVAEHIQPIVPRRSVWRMGVGRTIPEARLYLREVKRGKTLRIAETLHTKGQRVELDLRSWKIIASLVERLNRDNCWPPNQLPGLVLCSTTLVSKPHILDRSAQTFSVLFLVRRLNLTLIIFMLGWDSLLLRVID